MKDKILFDLKDSKHTLCNNNFKEITLSNSPFFVYETKSLDENGYSIKHTICTEELPKLRHFKIHNSSIGSSVKHICIDGGFIPYGQKKYDFASEKYDDGRPDCILFNENKFLFVELKLDQEEATFAKEDTKWKTFFGGVTQVEDFVNYWRNNGFEIKNYYLQIKAIVCMRFEPNFSVKTRSNTARNTELFKRSIRLGFEIIAHNHEDTYLI